MDTISPPVPRVRPVPGKLYLGLGIVLVLSGPLLYTLQIQAKLLSVPWYALLLASVGVVLLLLAVLRRPTVWRLAALVLGGLLAGAQGYFLLVLSKVPAYTGPVVAGVHVTVNEVLGYIGLAIAAVLMLRIVAAIMRDGVV